MLKPFMNVSAVATAFGYSRPTIYNMLKTGRFPIEPVQGSKPPRWRRADVEAFLTARDDEARNGDE